MNDSTKRWITDIVRVSILLILAGVALYLFDPANVVVFQALGIGVFMVGGTHLTRRVLFHRLDLQKIALAAIEGGNIAAAIVFSAVMAFLIAVLFLTMGVLK